MKDFLFKTLKIVLPACIGLYICWYFWNTFDKAAKTAFFNVFKEANYFILSLSLLVGLFSHYARAKRWLYALKPLGYQPSVFNSFNALMIGYVMNIVLPRMGEMSRAGVLSATDNVPFEKGFGSIVSERFVDLLCLLIIVSTALLINIDNIDDLLMLANKVNESSINNSGGAAGIIAKAILIIGAFCLLLLILLWFFKPSFRFKIIKTFKGFASGIKSLLIMNDKWAYILYTLLIWICYVVMFWIPFYALEELVVMPFDGILSAFIAGAIGFIIVQGGIGAYPLMVGIVITFYINPDYITNPGGAMPDHIGFGVLVWLTQTILIVFFGLFSFLMVRKVKKQQVNH